MILVGDGERVLTFDVGESHFCERCAAQRDFSMRLKYRYAHFYHLFGWVIQKQYQLACPICAHGWILDTDSAQARLGRNPIPFHQRSGWLVALVLIHLLAVAVLLQPDAG